MYKYIEKMLSELQLDMGGIAKTPGANHLFTVNDDAKKLNEEKSQLFNLLVTKLL